LRVLLGIAAEHNLEIHQTDVRTAFLNGELEEKVFIEPPVGSGASGGNKVWRLKKALYGLKQAANRWHEKFRDCVGS
jgi:hypothetical protein